MTTPAVTALLDQTQAAADQAHNGLFEAARVLGMRTQYTVPTGARHDILNRLGVRLLEGRTSLCAHLSPHHPEPLFWVAWRPGRLRCGPCAEAAARSIQGTREEKRCDGCKSIRPTIHCHTAQLPALACLDLFVAAGPLTVMFGLCPGCHATTVPEQRSLSTTAPTTEETR